MTETYHQKFNFSDGSVAVRKYAGEQWKVIEGCDKSKAAVYANIQNRFWKPWIKKSVADHPGDLSG